MELHTPSQIHAHSLARLEAMVLLQPRFKQSFLHIGKGVLSHH
jgi:hypothetical protein